MNGLTAADYADTGQWRLVVEIHATGMSAHLENTLHTNVEPQLLFSSSWEDDRSLLLRNVENAVYDHPRVLEDFSARIILYDRNVLFIPTAVAEESEGAEETLYTSLFEADPADVLVQADGDITAAYSPAPGIKGFISRTFPGARLGCNLMELVKKCRREGSGKRMCLNVRDGECDFLLLDNQALLSASTHDCKEWTDIVYHAFNIMDVYGVTPKECHIVKSGRDLPQEALDALERLASR